jgi:hypothetical protein
MSTFARFGLSKYFVARRLTVQKFYPGVLLDRFLLRSELFQVSGNSYRPDNREKAVEGVKAATRLSAHNK